MMKKLALFILPVFTLLAAAVFILHPTPAHASPFNANNLIDDAIFNNTGSINAAQIDSWLNSNFGSSSCISTSHGFSAPDPTGYSPSTGFTYGGNVSAGQVIYDAALAYGLNPQVLLVTLQKEQSLVTGGSGCSTLAYTGATGYGCPDGGTTYSYSGVNLYAINGNAVTSVSGTCVNTASKAGFSQQLIHAAWLLKFGEQRSEGNTSWDVQANNYPENGDHWDNSDDPQTCYGGPMTQGTFKRCSTDSSAVSYDGYITIDGSSTHMDTGATAALYWYTPHFSGNQNFDNLFQSWFGPIYAYTWQMVSQSSSTGSFVLYPGQQATFTLVAKNTGPLTWSNSTNPVQLATWDPVLRSSILDGGSWPSPYLAATLQESSVAPGGYGTFIFNVKAPNTTGLYTEHFNLTASGQAWFVDAGVEFDVAVRPINYTWQMVSQSSSAGSFVLNPGQSAQFTLTAKNTGDLTWNNSTNPVRLATWNPSYRTSVFDDGSWLSPYRAATLTQSSVAPGQTGTFVFNVRAPGTPGLYMERFNLVMEGVAWFTDPWMEFDINVIPPTWQMVSQSSSAGSFVLNKGQSAQFTLVAKNTGNVTWSNSTNPVRLATWSPSYRTSVFNDGSWVNQFRAATLQESSVAPGQTGTFVFNVRAPNVAGSYNEHFNLVMEGVTWFNDAAVEFDVIVH
jgi:hypothetical protein